MYKTHKIALNPNNEQRNWFVQQCGYARFTYNQALADFKTELERDTFLSAPKLNKRFNAAKKAHDWVKGMDQVVANKSIFVNLAAAINNWVCKRAKFPKFKRRGKHDSFTTNNQCVEVKGKQIKLPKIGWIRMFESLRFVGKIMKVTVSRVAHRWFVSITVEVAEDIEAIDTSMHPAIGIDVGINTLATCSDGEKYGNPRPLKRYERRLAREQRRLSKRKLKSNNWYKQLLKVQRVHYKIACIRNDTHTHHKVSNAIVKKAAAIGIETLKITNLLKNKKLSKALSDTGIGIFLTILKTKAEARGITIVEADQFYASSKTCSGCGHKKKDLQLKDRTYHCGQCGTSIDRDVNAAINLRNVAVGHTETQNACGVLNQLSVQETFRIDAQDSETGKVVWKQLRLFPI